MAEMYSRLMTITPEMADRYIKTNPKNRSIKREKVKKLVDDINNGQWQVTHQGIAFDETGKLIDGHHRLTAIVETKIPLKMMVTFNAIESEKIDIGASRSEIDSLYMAGIIDKDSIEYCNLTYPLISFIIDRSFDVTRKSRECSATNKHNVYTHLRDIIDPIILITKRGAGIKGRTRSAPILYAMMCAYNSGVDLDVLKKWHYIASTGDFYVEGNNEETKFGRSILFLKEFLDTKGRGTIATDREEVMKKAMSSIRYYSLGQPVKKLYGSIVYKEIKISENELHNPYDFYEAEAYKSFGEHLSEKAF